MVCREPTEPDRADQWQWDSGLHHFQGPDYGGKFGGLHLSEDSEKRWRADPRWHPGWSDSSACRGRADVNTYLKTKADRYTSAYTDFEAAHCGATHPGSYRRSTSGHTDTQPHLGLDTDGRLGSDNRLRSDGDASAYAHLEAAHYRTAHRGPYHSSTNSYSDLRAHLDTHGHLGGDGDTPAYTNEHRPIADSAARGH